MSVSNLRPKSPEKSAEELNDLINKWQRRKKFLEESMVVVGKIKDDIGGELWKHIKEKAQGILKLVDDEQNNLDAPMQGTVPGHLVPDRNYWYSMGKKKVAAMFLAIEEFVQSESRMKDSIDKAEQEIRRLGKLRDAANRKSAKATA